MRIHLGIFTCASQQTSQKNAAEKNTTNKNQNSNRYDSSLKPATQLNRVGGDSALGQGQGSAGSGGGGW